MTVEAPVGTIVPEGAPNVYPYDLPNQGAYDLPEMGGAPMGGNPMMQMPEGYVDMYDGPYMMHDTDFGGMHPGMMDMGGFPMGPPPGPY